MRKQWLFHTAGAILLGAFAWVIYAPGFKGSFHLDDFTSIVQNRYIRIDGLAPATLFRAAFQDFRQNRPLTNLSFALNYYAGRLHPSSYHLVNFCILLFSGLGLWLWLCRLFARLGFPDSRSMLTGWLGAMAWIAHPLNVQAVTYITQRGAALAGGFSLWCIYFYHLALEDYRRRWLFHLGWIFFCLLALLSKETALVLPAIVLAYKIYFFDEPGPGWLKRNWKWLALLAVFYLAAAGFLLRPGIRGRIFEYSAVPFSGVEKFLSGPRTFFWYLALTLFPFPSRLSLSHDFPVSSGLFSPLSTFLSWLALLCALFLVFIRGRLSRMFSFAVIWFLGWLLVEAMPLPIDLVNEHRLYLAMLAVMLWPIATPVLLLKKPWPAVAAAVIVICSLGFFSRQRNQVWLDELSLWMDVTQKSPGVGRWWSNYCGALLEAGKLEKAGAACRVAVGLDPRHAGVHINLGNIFFQLGDYSRAGKEYEEALGLEPQSALAYFDLALVRIAQQDLTAAGKLMAEAERVGSPDAVLYFNLGQVYEKLEEPANAMRVLQRAVALRPEWSEPRLKLAGTLLGQGRCREAVELVRGSPVPDPRFEQILRGCGAR